MQGRGIGFRVAMRPGKRRALPNTPEARVDDLIETAKAHFRSKVEHPFRVIKRQFAFQKPRLRGMLKNHCKVKALSADLSNLHMSRHEGTSKVTSFQPFQNGTQVGLVYMQCF